ncbi:MAG: molybdopterin-dependent oxidoreductase [Chloroflexi bacterium]|nr:molybdopterin-dependent oxidoreductase [Chloroflexota bacterium]
MLNELSIVGKRLPQPAAVAKATGTCKYTTDITLPGMLVGMVLRSPNPHARILKIDTSRAESLPGIKAVITRRDVPDSQYNRSMVDLLSPGKRPPDDEYVLADKARFVGDAVAAVAAVDEAAAERALELIKVEYEELPAVFDPLEAMMPGAPRIHDYAENNAARHIVFPFKTGDVEQGFREADHVVEATFHTSKQAHSPMESAACIASFDAAGRLTVWSTHQKPFPARTKLAGIFDMPVNMIRWLTPPAGGGFGNGLTFRGEPVCVALARKARQPVKLSYSREEQFMATDTRQAFVERVKMGVRKDGTITALQTYLVSNSGAYCSTNTSTTVVNMVFFLGFYRCQNVSGEADVVYTNMPVTGGFRGYGNSEATWALEQLIDMAAEKIGMDPMEFRLRNVRRAGDPSPVPALPIESSCLDECIRVGGEKAGWGRRAAGSRGVVKKRGLGMAIATHVSGGYGMLLERSHAAIKVQDDGSALLVVNINDMGQGIETVLLQIAAEELGLRYQDVRIVNGDTDAAGFDVGCASSRSTYIMGTAVMKAAAEAKRQLLELAARTLEVEPNQLEVRGSRVFFKANSDKDISVARLVRENVYGFQHPYHPIEARCGWEPVGNPLPYQAAFAEVEVDSESGHVRVLRVVVAYDIGRAINPMNVEGQLEGSIAQGMGYTLMEDFVVDRDTGELETDNFTSYKIPGTLDMPDIETVIIEHPTPSGPFGAKSVGEIGYNAICPAISNAIYNAIGVRITDLPVTPEKIRAAMKGK